MALTKVSTGMLEAGAASVDLNLDDGTFYIDVANGRVGVGTTTPSTSLEVSGDTTLSSATVSGALGTNTLSVSSSATIDTLTVSTTATVPYDNTISGLTATNVQSAITELNTLLGGGNVGSQATWNIYEFTTTANQTSFDISTQGSPAPSYVPGYVQVYLNGILLGENDYTAVDGTTINFSPGITNAGQLLSVVVLDSFNTAELLRVTSIDASASTNSISIDSTDQVTLSSLNVTGTVTADTLVVGDSSSAFTLAVIQSSTSGESELRMGDTDTDAGSISYTNSDDTMTFRAAAAARMSLNSTGLDVTGTVTATDLTLSDSTNPTLTITDTTNTTTLFLSAGNLSTTIGTTTNHPLTFDTNNTEAMRIDSSGNVGIGTNSPSSILEVTGTGDADTGILTTHSRAGVGYTLRLNNTNNGADKGSGVKWSSGGFDTAAIIGRSDAVAATADAPGYLTFHTSTDGSEDLAERMRIDSSGNVGIGTSPSTTLHLLAASTNIRLEDSDTNAYGQVGVDNAGSLYLQADNGNGQASSNMYMYVDGVERMRIDNNGNILTAGNGDALVLAAQGTATDALTQYSSDELKFLASGWDTNQSFARTGTWMIRTDPIASVYPDFDLNFYDDVGGEEQLKVSFHARATANHADPKSATFYGNVIINQGDQTKTNAGAGDLIINDGDLLVGTTNTTPGISDTDTGISMSAANGIIVSRDNEAAANLNRNSSDGAIALFRKDGAGIAVGSIGTFSDKFYFAGANEGIAIDDSLNAVIPVTNTGAGNNDAVDLGASGGPTFKDLYLSGGVVFPDAGSSGTATSSSLDSYEEGTWVPTLPNGGTLTVQGATYTKIGRMVNVKGYIQNITPTANTSQFQIGGLPFTTANIAQSYGAGSISYSSVYDVSGLGLLNSINNTYLYFHYIDGTSGASLTNNNWISTINATSGTLIFEITYYT